MNYNYVCPTSQGPSLDLPQTYIQVCETYPLTVNCVMNLTSALSISSGMSHHGHAAAGLGNVGRIEDKIRPRFTFTDTLT